MFRKCNFTNCAEKIKKTVVFLSLFGLLLTTACYQRFERLSVRATNEGIIFSHPKMDEAVREGNLCVFGEIIISRRDSPNDTRIETWFLSNPESGFQPSTEPMKKPYIVYGEVLPQTRVITEPKPLREGRYEVTGVVGIYNQKRELLTDLSLNDDFVLTTDNAGKLIVSATAEK